MVLIKYFVPEDGDDEEHPNVFSIHVINEKLDLNLREVKKGFPLPGNYHFRFLTTLGPYTAWLDMLNDEDIAPFYNGGYFCKVTRISNNSFRDLNNSNSGVSASYISKDKISLPTVHNDPPPPPLKVATKPTKSVPIPSLPSATSSIPAAPKPAPAEKLLRFDDDGGDDDFSAFASSLAAATTTAAATAPAALLEEDLLGMDTTTSSANLTGMSNFPAAAPRAASSAMDLLGLDALQPVAAAAPMRPQRPVISSSPPGGQSPIPPGRSNPAMSVMGGISSQTSAAQQSNNLRGMGMGMGMGMGSGSSGNLNSLGMSGAGRGGSTPMSMNGGRLGQGSYDPFNDLTGLNPPASNTNSANRTGQQPPQQQRR